MDDIDIKYIYNNYIKEICHYSQKQVFATSYQQKNYFQQQIDEAAGSLFNFLQDQIIKRNKDTVQVQAFVDIGQQNDNSQLNDNRQQNDNGQHEDSQQQGRY